MDENEKLDLYIESYKSIREESDDGEFIAVCDDAIRLLERVRAFPEFLG